MSPGCLSCILVMAAATVWAMSCVEYRHISVSGVAYSTSTGCMRPLLSTRGACRVWQMAEESMVADMTTILRSSLIICCVCLVRANAVSELRLRS